MTELKKKLKLWQYSKHKLWEKLKLWENLNTQIVTILKNSNCDKTQNKQIVTKLEEEKNCDKTHKLGIGKKVRKTNREKPWKLKLWQN